MSPKSVHRYLGLALCLIMLSISISGVLLVWKREYLWLTIPSARAIVDDRYIANALQKIESTYAKNEVQFVQLYSENLALHKVFLSDKRYAWHSQKGDQLELWTSNERIEDWLLDLHHRFLLGNTIGLNIAGFGGLLLMPLLIIGLFIWWPRRRFLKLGLWPGSFQRGAIMRSHGNLGGVSVLPIFLLALTGVILVYPVESRWFLVDFFTDRQPPIERSVQVSLEHLAWDSVIAAAGDQFPSSRLRWARPSSEETPNLVVGLQQAGAWNRTGRTSMTFSDNPEVIIVDAFEQPRKERIFGFSYSLHAGKLGLWYRMLLTVFGLALGTLCVFGLLSFLKRKED